MKPTYSLNTKNDNDIMATDWNLKSKTITNARKEALKMIKSNNLKNPILYEQFRNYVMRIDLNLET